VGPQRFYALWSWPPTPPPLSASPTSPP